MFFWWPCVECNWCCERANVQTELCEYIITGAPYTSSWRENNIKTKIYVQFHGWRRFHDKVLKINTCHDDHPMCWRGRIQCIRKSKRKNHIAYRCVFVFWIWLKHCAGFVVLPPPWCVLLSFLFFISPQVVTLAKSLQNGCIYTIPGNLYIWLHGTHQITYI